MSLPISPIRTIAVPPAPQLEPAASAAGSGGFHSLLEGMIGGVERSQAQAQQAADSFLNGSNEELHSVALATQRAELQFELLLQVRTKAVQAYQQIMQMQV